MVDESTTQGTGEQAAEQTPNFDKLASIASALGGKTNPILDYINEKSTSAGSSNGSQQQQIKIKTGASVNLSPKGAEVKDVKPEDQKEVSDTQEASTTALTEQEKQPETEDDITLEHGLFGGKLNTNKKAPEGGEGKEPVAADLNTIDGLTSLFKSKFGIESVDKLPEKIESLVANQAKVVELESQMNGVTEMFSQMDPQLYQMILTWRDGGNWKELASNSVIDYGKEAKAYDDKTLVNAIMPGKISDEEWEEYAQSDCDPRVKNLVETVIEASKEKFNAKAESIKSESARMVTESTQRKEKFEASIQASQSFLASKYPDADKAYLSGVVDEFKTGKVWSLFTNEDGTLKEDAFLRYAMAKDGENLLQQSLKIIENRKESVGNQAILDHIADTPSGQKGSSGSSNGTGKVRPEVQEKIDFILGAGAKKSHF